MNEISRYSRTRLLVVVADLLRTPLPRRSITRFFEFRRQLSETTLVNISAVKLIQESRLFNRCRLICLCTFFCCLKVHVCAPWIAQALPQNCFVYLECCAKYTGLRLSIQRFFLVRRRSHRRQPFRRERYENIYYATVQGSRLSYQEHLGHIGANLDSFADEHEYQCSAKKSITARSWPAGREKNHCSRPRLRSCRCCVRMEQRR